MCFHRHCYRYIYGKTGNVAALVNNAPPPPSNQYLRTHSARKEHVLLSDSTFRSEPGKVLNPSHLSFFFFRLKSLTLILLT